VSAEFPYQSDEAIAAHMAHWRETPEAKGVVGRARVSELAPVDARAALDAARAIEHPWYRCQALASIAEANPSNPQAERWLIEALGAAYSQNEPNRVASVALWPLRLLVRCNPSLASSHTEKLLDVISREAHGLRRLDGLRAIVVAVALEPSLREKVLGPFRRAAAESAGWRTERIIDVVASVLVEFDAEASRLLLESRPPTRFTRASRARLSKSPDIP
jgi:hypothetical protein